MMSSTKRSEESSITTKRWVIDLKNFLFLVDEAEEIGGYYFFKKLWATYKPDKTADTLEDAKRIAQRQIRNARRKIAAYETLVEQVCEQANEIRD